MKPRARNAAVYHLVALTLVPIWVAAGSADTTHFAGDIGLLFGPVTDTCAFEFTLWTATAGGAQIGPVIERELRVRGGLYDVELDFGPEALEDGSRYLQVAVGCPAGVAELTTLTRRAFLPDSTSRSDLGLEEMPGNHGAGDRLKAALGTAFTYQGELQQSGSPVTGNGDFQFSLWDAASGGAQIGATVPVDGVAVDNGRFTAQLDFGAAAFDGEARWLEIAVDYPSGTGSFTTLSPRQPVSAAPYALQTRGIFVDDTGEVGIGTTNPQASLHVRDNGSRTLKVRNDASSGGVALQATAAGDTGWATAVDAYTASPGGVGVYAYNEAESGNAYGVAAETASAAGTAVFGHASNGDQFSTGIGVFGRSDGDDLAAGVFGESTAQAGYSYGVHGVARAGEGVRGENLDFGNRGSLGTDSAGVAGQAASASDYAGYFAGGKSYFEGNVGIGTSAPSEKLEVAGDSVFTGNVTIGSSLANSLAVEGDIAVDGNIEVGNGNWVGAGPSSTLLMFDDIGKDLTILGADLGIGPTSPDEMLHIRNSTASGRAFLKVEASHSSDWGETGIRFATPQNRWHLRMDDDANDNLSEGALGLRCNTLGHETMTWTEDGNVGVGTAQPSAELDVVGDLEVSGAYRGSIGPNNGAPFPRPAYDSGWVAIAAGEAITFTHGVGGDIDDHVIDLQCRNIRYYGPSVHNIGMGGLYDWNSEPRGVNFYTLASTSLKVDRWTNDSHCEEVRVRIWVVN
jgi:hypothetical protein